MNCIFCKIIRNELFSFKVWENKNVFVFLDIMPINEGHILIIPKKHNGVIFELDENLYTEIFNIARKLSKPLKIATVSKRIGLAIEGFGVDHSHIHLVPINNSYELDPNRAKEAKKEDLIKMQKILTESFLKIK